MLVDCEFGEQVFFGELGWNGEGEHEFSRVDEDVNIHGDAVWVISYGEEIIGGGELAGDSAETMPGV